MEKTHVNIPFNLQILSSTRTFPKTPLTTAHHVPLSIIDATVVNFAPTSAIWYFPPKPPPSPSISPPTLKSALEETLNAYPQFCGRLHWAPYSPGGSPTEKWGRLMLSYGGGGDGPDSRDPGVEFIVAAAADSASSTTLAELVPSIDARPMRDTTTSGGGGGGGGGGVWDASRMKSKQLLVPATKLAPPGPTVGGDEGGDADADADADAPCLVVQVTSFACGGTAVAVLAAHPVADALALSAFVADFADNASRLGGFEIQSSLPLHASGDAPVFDPSLLDKCAAGDISNPQPDSKLVEEARTLPCHRYDWWDPLSASGCPWSTSASVMPVSAQDDAVVFGREGGETMPWEDWDIKAPVAHYLVRFSGDEIMKMWETASTGGKVSKHDALVAHVWSCINRARGLEDDTDDVHLDISIGLRGRVSPKLPDKFMGSPIMLAAVSVSGREACQKDPAGIAQKIRSTLSQFTDKKIAAHLHEKLYETSPQRIWQAFQGRRHVIVTSWVGTGVYSIDFGQGRASYVEAIMPSCDGCVQTVESPFSATAKAQGTKAEWWEYGADVSLHLESNTMMKFLKDPLLRRYTII